MAIKIGYAADLSVDSELVRTFYATNWKRRIALADQEFYDWQFVNTPNGENKDGCVIAYDDEKKEVLGVMGLTRKKFFLNNNCYHGAELTTWLVVETAIGSGLGAKILAFIQREFEVLIGMGISEMALPIYMRSGFRFIKCIPRFIKVINYNAIKNYSISTALAPKLINKWSISKTAEYSTSEVTIEKYTNLFIQAKNDLNLFDRSDPCRLWRYDQHPFFKYKQFLIEKANNLTNERAFVALREESSLPNFKILHVLDLFGHHHSIPLAIKFIEDHARSHGFDVIDFYCTASSIYRFMLSDGWFSINDDACFQFPHLFHPVEMRTPPTTSMIYWSKNNLSELADISKLYITKQDVDLDRPTMHTIESLRRN